ncbi:MAG: aldehyde dehydrogenase family protein [Myxococcota bacterium]
MARGKGSFINGAFYKGRQELVSTNPAQQYAPVFTTTTSLQHVDDAVQAAQRAFIEQNDLAIAREISGGEALEQSPLGGQQRAQHLRFRDALDRHADAIAQAITAEMGKPLADSLQEAKSLGRRVERVLDPLLQQVDTQHIADTLHQIRHHPRGVCAVLGPFNFPAHLLNAYVVAALATGNTVVCKPSEVCPWVGELYAKCAQEAQLPPGVFNMVQGDASIGAYLAGHAGVQAVLFTGSFAVGQQLRRQMLEQPHKVLALEMGGKNMAVVMNDANLTQALREIVQGALVMTGQRCTSTSRVLVQRKVAPAFIEELQRAFTALRPGDPLQQNTPFGPLATKQALQRFCRLLQHADAPGCEALVTSQTLPGGAFVTPSLHLLHDTTQPLPGYLDEELFGPNVCVEVFDELPQAIERVRQNPYGLSNSIFTANKHHVQTLYTHTHCGVLNWNTGTGGLHWSLPFGGVGKSGNHRPAGSHAVHLTTYPVAFQAAALQEDASPLPAFAKALTQSK